jgi:hypothetical protein
MIPRLDSYSGGTYGQNVSSISWTHTIANYCARPLVIVGSMGREENGEQNPEETNYVSFGGRTMTRISANSQEFGSSLSYWYGTELSAGNYTVTVYYYGSGTPNKARGISAVWDNIKQQAPTSQQVTTGIGGTRSLSFSTSWYNDLVVCTYGWRVGFSNTWSGNVTQLVVNRGDNAGGIAMAYAMVPSPIGMTVTAEAGNSEDNGLIETVWRLIPDVQVGGIL